MITYKGYYIKPTPRVANMHTIVVEGRGGKIPNVLGGMFTSPTIAKQKIDAYLKSKPAPKEKGNANQAITKSGD